MLHGFGVPQGQFDEDVMDQPPTQEQQAEQAQQPRKSARRTSRPAEELVEEILIHEQVGRGKRARRAQPNIDGSRGSSLEEPAAGTSARGRGRRGVVVVVQGTRVLLTKFGKMSMQSFLEKSLPTKLDVGHSRIGIECRS